MLVERRPRRPCTRHCRRNSDGKLAVAGRESVIGCRIAQPVVYSTSATLWGSHNDDNDVVAPTYERGAVLLGIVGGSRTLRQETSCGWQRKRD